MKAIIIAAGMGNRLKHLTKDHPKCLLKIHGKPMIERQIEIFQKNGITDISIVTGYRAETLSYLPAKKYFNIDYKKNNILFSLMYAEQELCDDVLVTYSDIVFEERIVQDLIAKNGDYVLVCDAEWKEPYLDRSFHPLDQTEKVTLRTDGTIEKIGKHLQTEEAAGEFIGLLKFSKFGAEKFRKEANLAKENFLGKSFHHASTLEKAYLTDLFEELILKGEKITPLMIKRGWNEIDTIEDFLFAGGTLENHKIPVHENRKKVFEWFQNLHKPLAIHVHDFISACIAENAVLDFEKTQFEALIFESWQQNLFKKDFPETAMHQLQETLQSSEKPILVKIPLHEMASTAKWINRLSELEISGILVSSESAARFQDFMAQEELQKISKSLPILHEQSLHWEIRPNLLLRASLMNMQKTANSLLKNSDSSQIDLLPEEEIINLTQLRRLT